MFSDKKHLSAIIPSLSGKSSKKALIEPKTLFNGPLVYLLGLIFSHEKHLSMIIASISGKSTKKALIEPKTLFKGRLVPFLDGFLVG